MPIPGFPIVAGYPVSGAQNAQPAATSPTAPLPPPPALNIPVNPTGTAPGGTVVPATITGPPDAQGNQGQYLNPAAYTNAPANPATNPSGMPAQPAQTFPTAANPGQIDPTTLYQTLSQLYDPGQNLSYIQQGEAIDAAKTQEGAQTASQLVQNQLQNQLYGVQGAQATSTLANQLGQYGLQTGGENQSYATALRSLNSSLGASGMAASGQAGLQRGDLFSTHQRNLAGLGISETQARQDQGYTEESLGLEKQRIQAQSDLAKALYAGDLTSAHKALVLLSTGATLTHGQQVRDALPDTTLGLGPGMPNTGSSNQPGASNTSATSPEYLQAQATMNSLMNQILGTNFSSPAPAATPLNVGG